MSYAQKYPVLFARLKMVLEGIGASLFLLLTAMMLFLVLYVLYGVSLQAYYDFKNKCVEELKPVTGCPHRNHKERLLLTGTVYCHCPN